MIFKKLINKHDFESVWKEIQHHYPESDKPSYYIAWEEIKSLTPKKLKDGQKMVIGLKRYEDDWTGEPYIDVSGTDPDSEFGEEYAWSLMLTTWQEWVGLEVSAETLRNFSETEVIAHILWEMTFLGFREEAILQHITQFKDVTDDIEQAIKEDRLDEVVKPLDLDDLVEGE